MNLRPIILGAVFALATLFAVNASAHTYDGGPDAPVQIQENQPITLQQLLDGTLKGVADKMNVTASEPKKETMTIYANVINQIFGVGVLNGTIDAYAIEGSDGNLRVRLIKGDQKAEQTVNFGKVQTDALFFMETSPTFGK